MSVLFSMTRRIQIPPQDPVDSDRLLRNHGRSRPGNRIAIKCSRAQGINPLVIIDLTITSYLAVRYIPDNLYRNPIALPKNAQPGIWIDLLAKRPRSNAKMLATQGMLSRSINGKPTSTSIVSVDLGGSTLKSIFPPATVLQKRPHTVPTICQRFSKCLVPLPLYFSNLLLQVFR